MTALCKLKPDCRHLGDTLPRGLAALLDRRVPRYTSYPTAPHFHRGIDETRYRTWLAVLDRWAPVSLYLHIPFCHRLCWYCGCHTSIERRRGPIEAYVEGLVAELDMVADAVGGRLPVSALHLGGGTPNMLPAGALAGLFGAVRRRFDLLPSAEIAAEIDPRILTTDWVEAAAAAGLSRASLGVQDVDPTVQRAINRLQPFATTERAVGLLRAAGVGSINLDLMYGLPYQTVESIVATVDTVTALAPERIALFGYAHVPWMKPSQKILSGPALPGPIARLEQQAAAAERLVRAGYVRIGLDSFVRPTDPLAHGARRNFQGYTTDAAATLIGLGASAIGRLPQGYVQATAVIPEWQAAVAAGRLSVARGIELSAEDRFRAEIIERLMCELEVDLDEVAARHGRAVGGIEEELFDLGRFERDRLVRRDGRRVQVTERGRPFVRSVCAVFDRYLDGGRARHAAAV
ncbi:MAG TPA: oxygen-independent coproporphyrinogen III oxidase [Geminicoccaceae bacterium]|nr:oxygen-independent coproporphyrinogen III oxidase [Geminicoccus sp.]HMU51764.1 oxygen-independent coproporphyrinogen III oxidase [Geminicoccaceae bacterium]